MLVVNQQRIITSIFSSTSLYRAWKWLSAHYFALSAWDVTGFAQSARKSSETYKKLNDLMMHMGGKKKSNFIIKDDIFQQVSSDQMFGITSFFKVK